MQFDRTAGQILDAPPLLELLEVAAQRRHRHIGHKGRELIYLEQVSLL